jgi:signal transduction histidine kinase
MDVGIAGALAAYGAMAGLTSGEYPRPGPVTAVLVGAAGAALVARRSHPRPGILLALSFLAVPSLLFGSYQAGSSLLIGLTGSFSAAAYGASRWFVAIAVVGFAVVDSLALAARGAFSEFAGSVAFVVLALGAAAAAGFVVCRLRALTAANIALRELVEHEAATLTHAAVEAERLRVAAELHDILSHGLGVVVLQTTAADHAWTSNPDRAREAVRVASRTALDAVDQLHTLLSVVRDTPDGGLTPVPTVADLDALAVASSSRGFQVDLVIDGTPRPVPAAVQASVYRVAQEGITNALRHSGARGCRIRIRYDPDAVTVQVQDDGSGSGSRPGSSVGSQLGLVGIRERARLFGGRVVAGPREPKGWRLRVEFPA